MIEVLKIIGDGILKKISYVLESVLVWSLKVCKYRITVFFCGCKFLRFVPKIYTFNFCDFIFCDFTTRQSDFYSLDDMKKLRVNLKHPAFYGHVRFSSSFSALLNTSINPSRPVSCSCEQKLIGMTQAIGSHSSWFELC